ncbi:hypothetical protein EMMF5_006363 [Cystobasidiomycetes sp. EMM_F5]
MSKPNITLYTFGTPNGFKASVTLEELALDYKTEVINISQNTQKEEWYLKINPNGRIPAIKDGELRVFETCAIMLYLTDKYDTQNKISFAHGTDEYYESLSWIMWQQGGLGPMQGQANHFLAMAKARSDYGIERYIDETKRLWSVLESRLKDHDWLVSDKYSIADIASFTWVRAGPVFLDLSLDEWPGVKRWVDRINAREAVQKGLQVGKFRSEEEMVEMAKGMRAKVAAMDNSDKH